MKVIIVADDAFLLNTYVLDPIQDRAFLFSWVHGIVVEMFGQYSHSNLLSFLQKPITVKRETNLGYFVKIKKKEFYIPKHKNVSPAPTGA